MFYSLLFLVIVLFPNSTYAQGAGIDDVLKSIDPGDRKAMNEDFLNETRNDSFNSTDTGLLDEGEGSRFDPMNEVDAIPRIRKEREIAEKEKEIVEAKGYDARMERECWCVFNPCLVLEAKLKDDLSTDAKRLAERRADAYNERAKTKKSLCRRWKEQKEQGRSKDRLDTLYRQLEALNTQSDEERRMEERLKQQRIADERRKRESQVAAEKAKIAAVKAKLERRRQEAAADRQQREARELVRCQALWDKGRNPCSCAHLPGAPVSVQTSRTQSGVPTCEK
ncbi:MAG: hypothetical protein OXE44_13820 [Nitrospinae bacterium]|nr:hypothetical protein [Nitrospinota bacterium]